MLMRTYNIISYMCYFLYDPFIEQVIGMTCLFGNKHVGRQIGHWIWRLMASSTQACRIQLGRFLSSLQNKFIAVY